MTKVFTIIFFIFVIAWAAGFRLHPESVSDYLPFASKPKNFRKVDLKSGGSVVGLLHRQTEEEVVLSTEGGFISFKTDEIVKMEALNSKQAASNRFWGVDQRPYGKPLLTYRPEDSLFYDKSKAEALKAGTQEAAEEEEVEENDLGSMKEMLSGGKMDLSSLRNNPMNVMNEYMQYQDQMSSQLQGIESMMGMMSEMASSAGSGGGSGSDESDDNGMYSNPFNS